MPISQFALNTAAKCQFFRSDTVSQGILLQLSVSSSEVTLYYRVFYCS